MIEVHLELKRGKYGKKKKNIEKIIKKLQRTENSFSRRDEIGL